MKKIILLMGLPIMLLATSCNPIKSISKQDKPASITIQTIPAGAKVYQDGKLISMTTPAVLTIEKNFVMFPKAKDKFKEERSIRLQLVKEGYNVREDVIQPTITNQGAYCWLSWPENLIYELKERTEEPSSYAYQADPTIPIGAANERVTRDTSGNTSLERNIIRWYFDSAPQGARIFWRVISSVPAEVKNTNELWLGNTPFEETRSFNIQGLTYANSRDVQIEIKVRQKGYVEQTKRFNVRQAIDQQEISSFFDLVEERR